jgi:predicted  nucleic acid-binding Zn-ribbon protein
MAKLPPLQHTLPPNGGSTAKLETYNVQAVLESPGVPLELLGEAEISVIMADLNRLPEEIAAAQARVIDLEIELARYKGLDLPRAKGDLDLAANGATMEALAKGLIDGKNAEQRKLQTDAYLAKDPTVAKAQAAVAALEGQVATIEAQIAGASGEYKALSNKFAAARAQAELWAARLRALAALA